MTGGLVVITIFLVVLSVSAVLLYGDRYGWWAALAERRSRPTPCRYCGITHATDVERRACDDRGLS